MNISGLSLIKLLLIQESRSLIINWIALDKVTSQIRYIKAINLTIRGKNKIVFFFKTNACLGFVVCDDDTLLSPDFASTSTWWILTELQRSSRPPLHQRLGMNKNWYQRLETESTRTREREREGDQQTRTREWDASTDRLQSIDHEKLKMLSWITI